MAITFNEHAQKALLPVEKKGGVCSVCGRKLPSDYYLLLSAWHNGQDEIVSPIMRFCLQCWETIEEQTRRKPCKTK